MTPPCLSRDRRALLGATPRSQVPVRRTPLLQGATSISHGRHLGCQRKRGPELARSLHPVAFTIPRAVGVLQRHGDVAASRALCALGQACCGCSLPRAELGLCEAEGTPRAREALAAVQGETAVPAWRPCGVPEPFGGRGHWPFRQRAGKHLAGARLGGVRGRAGGRLGKPSGELAEPERGVKAAHVVGRCRPRLVHQQPAMAQERGRHLLPIVHPHDRERLILAAIQ
eukprot:3942965-Prymnesium_polylepis.1